MVKKTYQLEVKEVRLDNIGLKVGERQLLMWQLEEKNWDCLKQKFSQLESVDNDQRYTRFKALENLDPSLREQIDSYSRQNIVESRPDWIEEELRKASTVNQSLSICYRDFSRPFAGIKDMKKLRELLDAAALQSEEGDSKDSNPLMKYTEDQKHFYQIQVIDRDAKPTFMTFEEAMQKKICEKLLDAHLRKRYSDVRLKYVEKFQDKENKWKSFSDVKEDLAAIVFADVLQAIEKDCRSNKVPSVNEKIDSKDFYSSYRFFCPMREVLTTIKSQNSLALTRKENEEVNVYNQWKILAEGKNMD